MNLCIVEVHGREIGSRPECERCPFRGECEKQEKRKETEDATD